MIYVSGIPQMRSQNARVFINFDGECIGISLPLGGGVDIPKEDLLSVQEKTEEQISKDVTLTRLLAFGIFAFGLKKKRKSTEKYLILSYMDGSQQMAAVFKDHTQSQFRRLYEAIDEGQSIRNTKLKSSKASDLNSTSDPVLDQLSRLNELRKDGAITEEEFVQLKANILGNR